MTMEEGSRAASVLIGSEDLQEIRARLLRWYDIHRRDLPWRRAGGGELDPYHVWVSEVMLQQTRAETVIGYYERWLERFPTLEALASAPADEVMKAWEGLGYYSRPRNLHRAAREVVQKHGGRVPDDPRTFRALPGVGPYTAGAVLSIAFGRDEPIVDGNVRRVFARWSDDPDPADRELWETAGRIVARASRPGDLNQALMELGATVCTPRVPACEECPVRPFCRAFEAGTQAERPLPRRVRPVPHERHAVAVVTHRGYVLLVRRPAEGRLGGMWEFPGAMMNGSDTAGRAAVLAVSRGLGLAVAVDSPIGHVEHRFTHVRVTYEAVACSPDGAAPSMLGSDVVAWVTPHRLQDYALPVAQKRIAALAFP